jgi:uncharacterized HAD superfamily protein
MKIGVDMDSVVADIMSPLIDFHNKKYKTSIKFTDHVTFSIEKVWNCTEEEAIDRIIEFNNSPFMDEIKPMPGSIEGIKHLSSFHELHIITSRSNTTEKITDLWIKKHFPNIFKTINHTNQSGKKESKKIKKSEVAKKLGINLFIEDHLEYALDCASLDIRVLLMNMPWNQTKNLPKNIIRVYSWKEIIDITK